MRSKKGSHRIVVHNVEYRWRATGNDGYICVGIWPSNSIGPFIKGSFKYHSTYIDHGNGIRSSAGDQIVITNRLVRRIIEHAVANTGYDPKAKGTELNLGALECVIRWDDAVRASDNPT